MHDDRADQFRPLLDDDPPAFLDRVRFVQTDDLCTDILAVRQAAPSTAVGRCGEPEAHNLRQPVPTRLNRFWLNDKRRTEACYFSVEFVHPAGNMYWKVPGCQVPSRQARPSLSRSSREPSPSSD